jgi:hypothetical protein
VLAHAPPGLGAFFGCAPGTSSVSASLSMPRFHFRRGAASCSPAGMAEVVVLPVAAGGCFLRQGVMLTMVGGRCNAGGEARAEFCVYLQPCISEMVEQRIC